MTDKIIKFLVITAIIIESTTASFLHPSPRTDTIPQKPHRPQTAFRPINTHQTKLPPRSSTPTPEKEPTTTPAAHIIFPGGGIFFYWQIGAASHLRSSNYDLSRVSFAGASAGALAATLTATDVDFVDATELALALAEEKRVWDRPLGLQGVWGGLIERWLVELIPEDAVEVLGDRLALLVTPVPSFGKSKVTEFKSKEDLIKCNMASIHLPWFLDGKITSEFRNSPHIDGSFLSQSEDYLPEDLGSNRRRIVTLDWTKDPVMAAKKNDFVKLVSKEGIWDMVEQGRQFAESLDNQGKFDAIPKLNVD